MLDYISRILSTNIFSMLNEMMKRSWGSSTWRAIFFYKNEIISISVEHYNSTKFQKVSFHLVMIKTFIIVSLASQRFSKSCSAKIPDREEELGISYRGDHSMVHLSFSNYYLSLIVCWYFFFCLMLGVFEICILFKRRNGKQIITSVPKSSASRRP